MAYLVTIAPATCRTCGKKATRTLVDRWNGNRGDYCAKHAEKALARLVADTEAPARETKSPDSEAG